MRLVQPLTHHEILELISPFSRRGYHVDLGTTDRQARRVKFRSVVRDGAAVDGGGVVEDLELDAAQPDDRRLIRTLRCAAGPAAKLTATGEDWESMLQRIASVAPGRQFKSVAGVLVAYDFDLSPVGRLSLTHARATVAGGLSMELAAPTLRGEPATVVLGGADAATADVPQDLLAVLGPQWSVMFAHDAGWRGKLRSSAIGPLDSGRLQEQFEAAVRHLVATFAAPPGRFHERWLAARWRVYVRRLLPLAACAALLGATAALPRIHLADHSPVRMLIFNLPPLLLGAFFCLREIPRIELPRPPRRPRADRWLATGLR